MLFFFRFIYNLVLSLFVRIKNFATRMFGLDDEEEDSHVLIDLTNSSSKSSQKSDKSCGLNEEASIFLDWSESRICLNKQLTDNEIFAASVTLRDQFRQIKGLFDPVALRSKYLKKNNFYVKFPDRFVQILHDGSNHWFTLSNMWSLHKNQVKIYDSWYQKDLYLKNPWFKLLLRRLMVDDGDSRTKKIECSVEPVQTQTNDIMCGVYAIAFTTDLCFGINPRNKIYNQDLLRQHLYKCLTEGYFQQFPSKSITRNLFKSDSFIITC